MKVFRILLVALVVAAVLVSVNAEESLLKESVDEKADADPVKTGGDDQVDEREAVSIAVDDGKKTGGDGKKTKESDEKEDDAPEDNDGKKGAKRASSNADSADVDEGSKEEKAGEKAEEDEQQSMEDEKGRGLKKAGAVKDEAKEEEGQGDDGGEKEKEEKETEAGAGDKHEKDAGGEEKESAEEKDKGEKEQGDDKKGKGEQEEKGGEDEKATAEEEKDKEEEEKEKAWEEKDKKEEEKEREEEKKTGEQQKEVVEEEKEKESNEKEEEAKDESKDDGASDTESKGDDSKKSTGDSEEASGSKAAGKAAGKEGAAPAGGKAAGNSSKYFDINIKGPCTRDIRRHCWGVKPGQEAMVDCLTARVKAEQAGNEVTGVPVTDRCKEDVRQFRIAKYRDLYMNRNTKTSCKDEIVKFCDDDFLFPEPGNIVACLREANQRERFSNSCRSEILSLQLAAADDMFMDPQLAELCAGEAKRLCAGVPPGGGRIQECLRDHRSSLQWDCQAELFRQEAENADDIRLNVRLFQACLNDQRKFCADVNYGDARVKDCLEEHRNEADFSPRCKTEFEKMMARRATDFRLDSHIRKHCKKDISVICYPDAEEVTDVASQDARVIQCLQDYRAELQDAQCREAVHRLTRREAEDIRFNKPLADACSADRERLCKDAPEGTPEVLTCLEQHMSSLRNNCRAAVFDELVRVSEDIDFKVALKQACVAELKGLCANVLQVEGLHSGPAPPSSSGRTGQVQCLQEHVDHVGMSEGCRTEVKKDLELAAQDYRFNFRIRTACSKEVAALCAGLCAEDQGNSSACGGLVLRCLVERRKQISSPECKKEVFSFTSLVAKDPLGLDLPLAHACAPDLLRLCPSVGADHSRRLACLRSKRGQLGEACRKEEMRFSQMEVSDIRLTPSLMNACGPELQSFCRDVPPSEGQAFRCLQSKLATAGVSAACSSEVSLQEARQASSYKLDVSLRRECEADVQEGCARVDAGQEGYEVVLRCLTGKYPNLTAACHSEVSYAVRMALWQYRRDAELTRACDLAAKESCAAAVAQADKADAAETVIGGVGQCLLTLDPKEVVSAECRRLLELAGREGSHQGGQQDDAQLQATLERLKQLEALTASTANVVQSGFVITGLAAYVIMFVLVAAAVAVGFYGYRQYTDPRRYTLVVKKAPVGV